MSYETPPMCSGAVVVHCDGAVTCTTDTCPRDLPRWMWFSLHSSFVRCVDALGADGCPEYGFAPSSPSRGPVLTCHRVGG